MNQRAGMWSSAIPKNIEARLCSRSQVRPFCLSLTLPFFLILIQAEPGAAQCMERGGEESSRTKSEAKRVPPPLCDCLPGLSWEVVSLNWIRDWSFDLDDT